MCIVILKLIAFVYRHTLCPLQKFSGMYYPSTRFLI